MESAIRGALEKAGIPGAQARRAIYDSARAALDRSLERQQIVDVERVRDHRQQLDALIAGIEAEWAPPPNGELSGFAAAGQAFPDRPTFREPDFGDAAFDPLAAPEPHAGADVRVEPAPVVASATRDSPAAAASTGDARLDIAPSAGDHLAHAPGAKFHQPRRESASLRPVKPGKTAKPGKNTAASGPRKEKKRRRPVFAAIFSGAVLLSFVGIGVWWLVESGALMSAEERDTGVPNPPPSLSRDDYAGGPQQLIPGAGFSGEWASVFTPGRDGAPTPRGNASIEVIEQEGGNVLRIVSGAGDETGEVLIPLAAEVMQALAGRQSVLALTVRSVSSDPTQIYVRCEFSVLGECGRRRFDVSYETTDLLFSLDYDRALAPNEAGNLVINSDISGAGKGIDLLAVRIRPAN